MAVQLKREKKKLDGLHTQKRNHKFLHATGAAQHQVQNQMTPNRSMWDYLKRYKTDHVQSTLPKEANENASKDPRTGSLALSRPFGWHQYLFDLIHPLQGHKESPYAEAEAKRAGTCSPGVANSVRNPSVTASIDPLFTDPIHLKETQEAMRALNMDKSPRPDGITNKMLTGGGAIFTELLHDLLSSL